MEEVAQRQAGAPPHSVYGTTLDPFYQRGCLYLIDEVHLIYSAREWQTAGQEVEKYMSQLRKVNDDLKLITQHPGKVDKNFRRNATEWLYVRSMARARLLLGVSIPGKFRWTVYSQEPMRNDKPEGAGWFTVKNRGYGKLYNTMSGVGFIGKAQAPELQRKGRPMWVWFVALALIATVAYFLPGVLGRGVGWAAGVAGKSADRGIRQAVGLSSNVVPAGAASTQPVPDSGPGVRVVRAIRETETGTADTSAARMTGYSLINKRLLVFLDDGSTVVASAVDERYGALVDGKLVKWAPLRVASGEGYHPQPVPWSGIPPATRVPKYDGRPIGSP